MLYIHRWVRRRVQGSPIDLVSEKLQSIDFKSQIQGDIKEKLSTAKSLQKKFYDEKELTFPHYQELQTPQHILDFYERLEAGRVTHQPLISASLKHAFTPGTSTDYTRFNSHWTAFQSMSRGHLNFYFFWRQQALNGIYIKTDLSYLLLFAYELINYSFNKSASFNASILERLQEAYKERIPDVNKYLNDWLSDLLIEAGRSDLTAHLLDQQNHLPRLYTAIKDHNRDLTARGYSVPFDILFHQILSMCHEKNGLTLEKLLESTQQNAVFGEMSVDDVVMLIEHMATHDYLEFIKGKREFIVGLKGERLMRGKEFYSVFLSPANFEVIAGTKTIGMIDQDFPVGVGDNIILAGRFGTILNVNIDKAKIHVAPASNAKPPRYFGGAAMIHPAIHHKMMGVLCSYQQLTYLNDEGRQALEEARLPYRESGLLPDERPIWVSSHGAVFEPFAGTIIAQH
jgi:hypothetical protein